MQGVYGGRFCRVELNWVHSLSLVDSVKVGEEERPLPATHTERERENLNFKIPFITIQVTQENTAEFLKLTRYC